MYDPRTRTINGIPERELRMNLTSDKTARKEIPLARGFLDYFPLAAAEVAHVSHVGNQQHNPGEPLHWAKHKSTDHADCIARHLIERGTLDTDGLRHSAKVAWRALAMLQIELEADAAHGNMGDYDGGNIENGNYAEGFEENEARSVHHGNDNCRDGRSFYEQANGLKAGDGVAHSVTNKVYEKSQSLKATLTQKATDEAKLVAFGCSPKVAEHIVGGITYCGVQNAPYVYIAGPMRGLPEENFPAFDAARDRFVQAGFNVISPADIDRAAGDRKSADQLAFAYRDVFCLFFLKASVGGNGMVAVLPRFERSTGTAGEFFLSRWIGLPILSAISGDKLTMTDVCEADLLTAFEDFIKGQ